METTTIERSLDNESLFAKYGLPKQLVSDIGPQFTSREFEDCMAMNGTRHSRSAPYHPATKCFPGEIVKISPVAYEVNVNGMTCRAAIGWFWLISRNA